MATRRTTPHSESGAKGTQRAIWEASLISIGKRVSIRRSSGRVVAYPWIDRASALGGTADEQSPRDALKHLYLYSPQQELAQAWNLRHLPSHAAQRNTPSRIRRRGGMIELWV